jgi:hypothetical protein
MFRIHLEILTGKFVVQVLFMDFIWLSVRESDHERGRASSSRIRRFDTYSQARAWINSVGLWISLAEQQSKKVLYEGRRMAAATPGAMAQDSSARNSALV